MRLGLVINDLKTESHLYSTTRLGEAAVRLGHEVWWIGVGDMIYAPDGSLFALASSVGAGFQEDMDLQDFMAHVQGDQGRRERIRIDDLDVLLLRNDPADDAAERPWAQTSGILFGSLAVGRNVIVLNDPANLANAINKTYFQHFPEQVRPRTCISRDAAEIKNFVAEQEHRAVIKPLQGSGGQSVFLIREDDTANLNQMIDAVLRDGYCIAQEYLPAAAAGDIRLFVMNGRPLIHDGKYAAFRRVNKSGDARSNMTSGGESEAVQVDEHMLELVEMVRPKLVRDGMFLVGLDIVGDKLMEINVFSPGGLGSAQHLTGVNFSEIVVRDLERKVKYKRYYGRSISNVQIATL